ncbi:MULTISPECIES: hypothetical protein [unclassified Streptomyces]|uniref:hypothetical protein n=1 Tax=unclassified Streptomyces TaxID=2593676 RepID=UPI003822F498
MTPSSDRKGGKRSMRARAKEASSRLGDAIDSICLIDQAALVTQTFGVFLSLQTPHSSPLDHVTAALNLMAQVCQLYRTLKDS